MRGFTLLEVMIAIALLAIALTTLLGSQSQSMLAAEQADFSSQAALLARLKMTEIVAEGAALSESGGDFGDRFPGYGWKVETAPVAVGEIETLAGLAGRLRRIDLTVHDEQERRSFTLTRIVLREDR
ncbi:prepilin-type N-terminal cleavage/methylation domain-containing protein [Desulfofustis limnaeus]|uniref:General secretion pathway protein I n=1 Tax=Desulfofustis limnaeus TaxID=2740163 RepID=A0ABM7W6R7_9BACT|nr:prepilin-type N-terminal cleavage/methylation domain-containing protein [Desulfofustis limnaeus]BDD86649.1 hypothetical protein DPPLL_10140 [Desulfofustis limnaeus]